MRPRRLAEFKRAHEGSFSSGLILKPRQDMLPLELEDRKRKYRLLESDAMVRAQRFIARHSRNRVTIVLTALLFTFALYLLWPSTAGIRHALNFFPPSGYRPNYSNWPKNQRSDAVKEAFVHAYTAYEDFAMPADELRPLRNKTKQKSSPYNLVAAEY